MPSTQHPIKFTVVGGFLGAGKTSLVNRILASGGATRFAVMVNDFGALNIDESLITDQAGQIMQLANGCICCSLAGGLVEAMVSLMQYRDQIDHILIEASGVSNPSRIMDFARIDDDLRPGLTLVLVDAVRFPEQIDDPRLQETLHDQLASADLFLMTKTDLASAEDIAKLREIISARQPRVPIVALSADDQDFAQFLIFGQDDQHHHQQDKHDHHHPHDHGHAQDAHHQLAHDFSSIALTANTPIERIAFSRICKNFSRDLLRGKGVIHFTEGPMVWQQTGRFIDFSPAEHLAGNGDQESRLIVIALDHPEDVSMALGEIGFTPYQPE